MVKPLQMEFLSFDAAAQLLLEVVVLLDGHFRDPVCRRGSIRQTDGRTHKRRTHNHTDRYIDIDTQTDTQKHTQTDTETDTRHTGTQVHRRRGSDL